MAFKLACQYAFREAFGRAKPVILEPVMDVDVRAPAEFQGTIIGDLNRRKGVILNSEGELDDVVMKAQVLPRLRFALRTSHTHRAPLACVEWHACVHDDRHQHPTFGAMLGVLQGAASWWHSV